MIKATHPPLKRHVSLQPFSRDHYVGLVHAQHLIRSASAGVVERRKAVTEFLLDWDSQMLDHFADEERLLTPLVSDEDAARLRGEHAVLIRLADDARQTTSEADPGAHRVRRLGHALNDHIRWEERQLFERVQSRAPQEKLTSLARQTDAIEQSRRRLARRG
jgi:hypothetical protein